MQNTTATATQADGHIVIMTPLVQPNNIQWIAETVCARLAAELARQEAICVELQTMLSELSRPVLQAPHDYQVMLFGSRAHSVEAPTSDVDTVAIFPRGTRIRGERTT